MTSDVRPIDCNGKQIIEITVQEGPNKPYCLRDKGLRAEGVFVRRGTATIPVTEEMFRSMIAHPRASSYEKQTSFIQDLTFEDLGKRFADKGLPLDRERMESMHLIDRGRYTNLAYMLSDQFDQPIKAAVFPDEGKSSFLDRKEIGGSVLQQLDGAAEFIAKHNRVSSIISGMNRKDTYAYQSEVVREALVNAVAHRDYSMDSSILLSIYPDKLTIVSPGGPHEMFTEEELFRGVSSLRNRNLAAVLYRLELIEAYGTGIPRIGMAYRSSEIRPSLDMGASTFSITLPAMDCNERDDVVGFVKMHPEFTRRELQDELNLSKSEAVYEIKRMADSKRIVRIGNGRSIRYRSLI